jgi:hypothetical protein
MPTEPGRLAGFLFACSRCVASLFAKLFFSIIKNALSVIAVFNQEKIEFSVTKLSTSTCLSADRSG